MTASSERAGSAYYTDPLNVGLAGPLLLLTSISVIRLSS